MNSKSPIKLGRRDLLKVMTAGAGVLTVSAFLPKKWLKPVVDFGVSPVHAQASMEVGTITGHVLLCDQDGKLMGLSLPNAVVTVDGMPALTSTSDLNGLYTITNVPVGNRTITCVPPVPSGSPYVPMMPISDKNVPMTVSAITPAVQDFHYFIGAGSD